MTERDALTTTMLIWPGDPYPLGLRFDGTGANVAVHAPNATGVELCLFDDAGAEARGLLPEVHGGVWHGYLPIVVPGQRYGFRVHGPFDPSRGLLCNPAKLLLDPYGLAVEGDVTDPEVCGLTDPADRSRPDPRDSAPVMARSVVVSPFFDWGEDRPPRIPAQDLVIYEVHVKGATRQHPDVDERIRGTYAGLISEPFLGHLVALGVNAVELLPVQEFLAEPFLAARGLTNYWGYNPVCWFAPHGGYAALGRSGSQVNEFKAMVRELHKHGIEVILDVVYNHTGEGGHDGPAVSLRGFDPDYYRTQPGDPTRYLDFTGCGNSLNMSNSYSLQIVMDSLRYWVNEMHVDGFRFDLAVTLSREETPERLASFFELIQQDPVMRTVKLIAEPWDIGWGGYQVGNFPPQWMEWNGKYRDAVRDFWRGTPSMLPELATRASGSSDLYGDDGRTPFASVNFVTAHDGFTLADLVAYDGKHNETNGENNRDGSDDNRSWNGGVEGLTDDAGILALRARRQRSILTTLLLSIGTPMLLGGDELGRTQQGNNNAYCQDNAITWFDWQHADRALARFTQRLIRVRREHAVFRRRMFFTGLDTDGDGTPDIGWLTPGGRPMTDADWGSSWARAIAVYLDGDEISARTVRGRQEHSDSFYLCLNAASNDVVFTLPPSDYGWAWTPEVDSGVPDGVPAADPVPAGGTIVVPAFGAVVLSRPSRTMDGEGTTSPLLLEEP